MSSSEGQSASDRIRDAAISLFGEQGDAATSLKAIAAEAGVSQALIVHHYGSKDRLRAACDEHVARVLRTRKQEVIDGEAGLDPLVALRHLENNGPLLRYLLRAMTAGGERTAHLVDEMVADAEQYMARGEQAGLIKPSSVPRDRSVLLVIWSLGALVLHEHVKRLLDVDLLAASAPPEDLRRYLCPAVELYTQGLMEAGAFEQLADFVHRPDHTSPDAASSGPDRPVE